MSKSRTFHAAWATMRQLTFGKTDLALHLNPIEEDPSRLEATLEKSLIGYKANFSCSDNNIITRFNHIFGGSIGYASGYYSYKWAEVLDADAYSRFKKEGLFSREVGNSFRDTILSKGNSKPPDELYRNFMGRDPDSDAMLIRDGLLPH